MTTSGPPDNDIVVSLSRGRYAIMSRANTLIGRAVPDGPADERDIAAVSGLLMTALEELKVAEEELRVQNATLEAQRAGIDEKTRHYRQLFLRAPVPALITDCHGTILEANTEASALFRRAPHHLERKPFSALVPPAHRQTFRREFSRLADMPDTVSDWHFPVTRVGDVPVEVQAVVRLVPELGPTRSGVFFWVLREAPPPR